MTIPFSPTQEQVELINRMRILSAEARQPGTIKVQANDDGETAEILIYDVIGFDLTAKDFAQEVQELGNVSQINVRINSPGGFVFDGMAIYNILSRHRAKIIVDVDGIAASIAAVVAMAGDVIRMPENSMMMIHDSFGIVIGTEHDMRDMADIGSKLDGQIAGVFARRSKLSDEEVRQLMDDETWFTASEAVEVGMADELTEPVKAAAQFDLSQFRNAPAQRSESLRSVMTKAVKEPVTVQSDGPTKGTADDAERLRADAEAEAVAVRLRQIDLDDVLESQYPKPGHTIGSLNAKLRERTRPFANDK